MEETETQATIRSINLSATPTSVASSSEMDVNVDSGMQVDFVDRLGDIAKSSLRRILLKDIRPSISPTLSKEYISADQIESFRTYKEKYGKNSSKSHSNVNGDSDDSDSLSLLLKKERLTIPLTNLSSYNDIMKKWRDEYSSNNSSSNSSVSILNKNSEIKA